MGYFGIPFRNGVPIGLGSVASFGAQQFDPSSLFIGGTAGTFYDPSDPTTLFTTSTGTTPCAVPGSGSQVLVGLMLDKSQGAPGALGAELVTNGDFPVNTTGWTAVNSPTLSIGVNGVTIQNNGGTNGLIYQAITTVAGRMYKIEGTITYGGGFARIETSTTIPVTVGGGNINVNASGRYTWYFTAAASITYLVIGNRNDTNAANTYDNISVREIPGNHAIAFNDTTARPELSARVNLLTYSEQFDNGAWTKANATITTNAAVAPDGTLTADALIDNSTNADHKVRQGIAVTSGAAYTLSVVAKANTLNYIWLYATTPNIGTFFDLAAGTVLGNIGGAPTSSTISALGDGWYRCSITYTANATSTQNHDIGTSPNGTSFNYIGSGQSIFIWGADLRPANIGSAIPSYQRIADQYTYDSNGFPSYLRFDGVDDSMYTPASIPFATVTSDGLARRNLLSNPTQFDDAVWIKFASSVSANTFVAPDGSTTADTFAADGTNNLHRLQQAASGGAARTFSIYVKSNTAAFVQLLFDADVAPWANFDLTSGVVGSVGTNQTASIQNVGNGWFRCIVYSASTTATNVNIAIVSSASAARGEANTSSGTAFIWGAQLETGSTATAFQNIGTDKMSVFAGVRKLSDAAQGIFCELSSSTTSNNGVFRMTFPGGAGAASYAWLSKGTLQASITANLLAAPITNVVTGIGDIGNDDCTIRINGPAQVNQSTADQGTGNFGTYPLYLGARANTSLFFNGHLYSLIVAGAQLQSGSITATEQYVAGKTGVQI